MNDPHETMYNDDVAYKSWAEVQDLADIEYMEYCEILFKETEEKGLDPF